MENVGAVGIFWWVGSELVAAGCELSEAEPYGDNLTYSGGHAEHWERWQAAGSGWLRAHHLPQTILSTEYDDHPRGRIVKEPDQFVIYADKRLQNPEHLAYIKARFGLGSEVLEIRSDNHYRKGPHDF